MAGNATPDRAAKADAAAVMAAVKLMIASRAKPSEWWPVADHLADMLQRLPRARRGGAVTGPTLYDRMHRVVGAHLEAADHEAEHAETVARLTAMAEDVLSEAQRHSEITFPFTRALR